MLSKTSFVTIRDLQSPVVMAFNDPKYSSSKLQKLRLGTYYQRGELKAKGFTFNGDSKIWYRPKPFADDLTSFGILVDDPVHILSQMWSGNLRDLHGYIMQKSALKPDTVLQLVGSNNTTPYYNLVSCDDRAIQYTLDAIQEHDRRLQQYEKNVADIAAKKRMPELENLKTVYTDQLSYCRSIAK